MARTAYELSDEVIRDRGNAGLGQGGHIGERDRGQRLPSSSKKNGTKLGLGGWQKKDGAVLHLSNRLVIV